VIITSVADILIGDIIGDKLSVEFNGEKVMSTDTNDVEQESESNKLSQ
jgi:hypothetical protein